MRHKRTISPQAPRQHQAPHDELLNEFGNVVEFVETQADRLRAEVEQRWRRERKLRLAVRREIGRSFASSLSRGEIPDALGGAPDLQAIYRRLIGRLSSSAEPAGDPVPDPATAEGMIDDYEALQRALGAACPFPQAERAAMLARRLVRRSTTRWR